MTAEPVDHYEVLGLEPDADVDGIRAAILDQRRTWVRRQNAPSVERQRQAEDRIKAIAAAEDVLLDADRRADYDRSRRASVAAAPRVVLDKAAPPPPPPSNRAWADSPPPVPPTPPDPPQERIDWMARATEALRRGDLRSAKYAATEATERKPGSAHAWVLRGTVSRADNRLDHAIYEFVEASRLAPTAETYAQLASVNEAAGQIEDARVAYEAAARLHPVAIGPTIALANFWVRRSQPNTAAEILTPVYQRDPTNPTVANALGFALLYRVDSYLTMLNDGTTVFTSALQAQQGRTDVDYALSLPLDDPDLIARLSAKAAEADRAGQRVWSFPPGNGLVRTLGWGFLLLVAFAAPSGIRPQAVASLVALGLTALVIFIFVRVYRKPGWARHADRLRPYVQRWGI